MGGKILKTLFWVGGSRLAKVGSLQRLFYVPAFVLGQRFSVFVCLRLIRVKCFTYFGLFYSVRQSIDAFHLSVQFSSAPLFCLKHALLFVPPVHVIITFY